MARFARIDLQIRANRLILANRFRVPESTGQSPLFCESRFEGVKIANRRFEAIRANCSHVMSEDARRGWKKEGVENLTNDTPPKKGFWTPPRTARVSVLCFSCTKNPRQRRPEALLEGSKNFSGERVLWYAFLPPIRFAPPHITAQL